jgi:hypothetical protein
MRPGGELGVQQDMCRVWHRQKLWNFHNGPLKEFCFANLWLVGGKCKVSWSRVCRPIASRGLGIHDLFSFSHALRLRWLWLEWTSLDKLWNGSELPVDDTDRALFAVAMKVTVRNGQQADFWNSS